MDISFLQLPSHICCDFSPRGGRREYQFIEYGLDIFCWTMVGAECVQWRCPVPEPPEASLGELRTGVGIYSVE